MYLFTQSYHVPVKPVWNWNEFSSVESRALEGSSFLVLNISNIVFVGLFIGLSHVPQKACGGECDPPF